jgi:phosphatidylserine/phosphatidylglycerophosphate/cardiolipin synthase-like enzyme
MLRILSDRINAGVNVRVIGKVSRNRLPVRKLSGRRLHARTIVRDRQHAFVGSQSLRPLELDSRREIGMIFRNRTIVTALARTFDSDWKAAEPAEEARVRSIPVRKTARKMAKAVSKNLPVQPVVRRVVKAIQKNRKVDLRPKEVEQTVKTALKEAVRDSVEDAAKEVIKTMVETPHRQEADSN